MKVISLNNESYTTSTLFQIMRMEYIQMSLWFHPMQQLPNNL